MAEPGKSLRRWRDTSPRTQPIDSTADSGEIPAPLPARRSVLPAKGRSALPPARSLANIH